MPNEIITDTPDRAYTKIVISGPRTFEQTVRIAQMQVNLGIFNEYQWLRYCKLQADRERYWVDFTGRLVDTWEIPGSRIALW